MQDATKRATGGTLQHQAAAPAVAPTPAAELPRIRLGATPRTVLIWGGAFLLAAALPLVDANGGDIDGFNNAGVYVLLALGLNVVLGFAGLLDIGYAAFFALGAYTYGLAASFQLKPAWNGFWDVLAALGQVSRVSFGGGYVAQLHFTYWLMIPIAALVCAGWGLLFGAPTLRLKGDYLAIVTLGFGEIVPIVLRNASTVTNGAQGLPGVQTPRIFGFNFGFNSTPYYYLILALVGLVVFASYRLQYSRTGRAWLALREDELAAGVMGINHVKYKLMAFGIGASVAGIAGTYYVAKLTTATPDMFQFTLSTMILVMVVLGGMGSIPGVVVGALLLTVFQGLVLGELNVWAHALGAAWSSPALQAADFTQINQLIFGVVLVVMMLYRRQGIIPARGAQQALTAQQQQVLPGRGGFVADFSIVPPDDLLSPGEPLLEVKGLTKRFGGVTAASGIDLKVFPGEIISIIGPNGSGKTTFFNMLTGLYKPDAGQILFRGKDVTGLPPHEIARRGISRTFQNLRLFANLSILENVMIGQHHRLSASPIGAVLRTSGVVREEEDAVRWAQKITGLFGVRLTPRLDHVVSSLSYANRRRTEISRALVSQPRLLLLDEPSAGMNPAETLELMDQIQSLRKLGVTVVLIEHKLQIVNTISDRVVVLDYGQKIAEGQPSEVQQNPKVIEAYLGRTSQRA